MMPVRLLVLGSLLSVCCHSLLHAATSPAATNPLGHRLYTYSPNYTQGLTSFNTDPATKSKVNQVNVYGGWFSRTATSFYSNCTRATEGQQMLVTNSANFSIVVLQKFGGSKSYLKCSQNLPPAYDSNTPSKGMFTMDADFSFLLFVYNTPDGKEVDMECDPAHSGVPPSELHFPITQAELAQLCGGPRGAPPPPLAVGYEYDVTTQPSSNIALWAATPGVIDKGLTVVLDGRMNGCALTKEFPTLPVDCGQFPDFTNASTAVLEGLADKIAAGYCMYPQVSGVQVDLEPYTGIYRQSLNILVDATSKALRSTKHGCVSDKYPLGRSISLFAFPTALKGTGLVEAMGPNGMIVVSGYDLYTPDMKDLSMYNTVAQYQTKLQQEVDLIRSIVVPANVAYSLAIPVSASTHEYEQYTPGKHCGDICTAHDSGVTQDKYANAALDVVARNADIFTGNATSLFRGLSLWLWSGDGAPYVEYPNHSGNKWTPGNPSAEVLKVLKARLPILASTPSPIPPPPPTPPTPASCNWQTADIKCSADSGCSSWIAANCSSKQGVTGYCKPNGFCHFSGSSTVVPLVVDGMY